MAGRVNPICPACGFESNEIRCPRCNALKIVGCTGACSSCRTGCKTSAPPRPGAKRPSDTAREDDDLVGTPLEP